MGELTIAAAFIAGVRFVNDGSASKPKVGDPRACLALLDTTSGSLAFRRVEYDVEAAVGDRRVVGEP